MLEIARGLAFLTTDSQTKYIGAGIESLGAPFADLVISPAFVISVLVVAAGQVMLDVEFAGRDDGVRVVPAGELDPNTAQTPGMDRKAAITFARVGAQKLWAGTVHIHPDAKTGAHHHGHLESVIYVVKGRARMRWARSTLRRCMTFPFPRCDDLLARRAVGRNLAGAFSWGSNPCATQGKPCHSTIRSVGLERTMRRLARSMDCSITSLARSRRFGATR